MNMDEGQFVCGECGSSFTSHKALRCHETIHSVVRPYICPDCGAAFRQKGHLDRHKSVHTDGRPFQCLECGAAFRYVAHLRRHKFIHTGQRPFKCNICGHAFGRKDHLQKHATIHAGQSVAQPSAINSDSVESNSQSYSQQLGEPPETGNALHPDNSMSPYANGRVEDYSHSRDSGSPQFNARSVVTPHRESENAKVAIKEEILTDAEVAQSSTASEFGLKYVHHDTPNEGDVHSTSRNLQCSKCHIMFQDAAALESHSQPIECTSCAVVFPHGCDLEQHKCIVSRDEGSTVRCRNCGTVMPQSDVKSHVCRTQESHPVQCGNCSAIFSHSSALQYHNCVIHPVQCKECGMIFPNTSALGYHVCIRPMPWPYQCRLCGMVLPNSIAVEQHNCMHPDTTSVSEFGSDFNYPHSMANVKERRDLQPDFSTGIGRQQWSH